jgi:S1-C subfamily serine protease
VTEFQGEQVPRGGDAIVAVDGKPLQQRVDLADVVSLKRPGESVRLEVVHGGERRTVAVRLGERPQAP